MSSEPLVKKDGIIPSWSHDGLGKGYDSKSFSGKPGALQFVEVIPVDTDGEAGTGFVDAF